MMRKAVCPQGDFAPLCELEAETATEEADTVYLHKYM